MAEPLERWAYRWIRVWYADEDVVKDRKRKEQSKIADEVETAAWVGWSEESQHFVRLEESLSGLGEQGWELAGTHAGYVTTHPGILHEYGVQAIYVFKRRAE